MILHSQDKPFKCTYCEEHFKSRFARLKHQEKFHLGIETSFWHVNNRFNVKLPPPLYVLISLVSNSSAPFFFFPVPSLLDFTLTFHSDVILRHCITSTSHLLGELSLLLCFKSVLCILVLSCWVKFSLKFSRYLPLTTKYLHQLGTRKLIGDSNGNVGFGTVKVGLNILII